MKTIITATVIAFSLASFSSVASAADVGGNVRTNVKAGVILQSNKGIANKNELTMGSVTGKRSSVGGNFRSNVKVGVVLQSNKGIANKNEVTMGSVTE